jgi:hypothetical protein
MKNIIVVLAVFVVLASVSERQTASATNDASTGDVSSDVTTTEATASVDGQENQDEETVDDQIPYESVIDNRPPPSIEEYVPPETAGTIACSGKSSAAKVEIKGNLMIGLTSITPPKMLRRISLAKEGRACWGSSLWSVCAMTQPICTKVNKYDLICQPPTDVHAVFRNVPRMSFVPQIGGRASFDLKQWKIVGCVREGCGGVCHEGEKCRQGPSCTINSN